MKTSIGPMTIGTVARQACIGVETVRFYERRGLVQQPLKPTGAGMRQYPDEAIARIRFIREAQELGFSLREIAELLSLRAAPESPSCRKRRPSMKTLNFTIDGMRCEGCAATVRTLLEQETGMKAVQVAHDPGIARVLFDPAAVDETRLVAAIERPGYRVTATR